MSWDSLKANARQFAQSTNGRILAAASTVGLMTMLVRFTSLVKDIAVAHRFGTNRALDAFYVAMMVPTFLVTVSGESFRVALLPVYVELRRREGKHAAERLLSGVGAVTLVGFFGAALVPLLFRSKLLELLASGFSTSELARTEMLLLPLMVLLPLWGLAGLWRAVLTAHDSFAISSLSPVMGPAMALLMVIGLSSRWGIYALVAGTILGAAGDLVIVGHALRKCDVSLWPRWYGIDPSLRRVFAQCAPMVVGTLLMGSTTIVDQSMATLLGSGSVSALNYANKILTLPLMIAVYSMSVAVFPNFSELSARRDWAEMQHVLSTYTRLIIVISVAFTVLLFEFSEPLVRLVFQGGVFTDADAHLVAQVQALLCLQLPFYAVGILYVRAISAIQRNHVLMWGTVISVVANATLNIIFMKILGLAGIALSTSIVYLISCCYLRAMLYRALRREEVEEPDAAYAVGTSPLTRASL